MKQVLKLCTFLLLCGVSYAKNKPYDLTLTVKSLSMVDEHRLQFGCGWLNGRSQSADCEERISVCHVVGVIESTPGLTYELTLTERSALKY